MPAVFAVPQAGLCEIPASWDDARLERETAAMLQWAGKDCAAVVEMGQRPGCKYFEPTLDGKKGGPKEPLTREAMQAHLKGGRCLTFKQHKELWCRLMILDTDTLGGCCL